MYQETVERTSDVGDGTLVLSYSSVSSQCVARVCSST